MTICSPAARGVGVNATDRAIAMIFQTEVAVIVRRVNCVGSVRAGAVEVVAAPMVRRFLFTLV